MKLTNTTIRNTKPKEKAYRLFDGNGLYLEIAPSGGKWWRFKYRFNGKEKRISLGTYPEVSLKTARERRDGSRKLLSNGIDPSEHRKHTKLANSNRQANNFEHIAREWISKYSANWAQGYTRTVIGRLELNVFPWLGNRPISEISAPELLATIRRIENRGILETAHRVLNSCGQIFRYAIATGRADRDPSQDLKGSIPPAKGKHFSAVTDPKEAAKLLRTIDGYKGTLIVQCALQLAPLVFVRPGELRQAKWKDIDFEKREWRYTVTKTETEHIVPLSEQAMLILNDLHPLTGTSTYIFPSARTPDRPMSDNAILAALRRLGIPKEEMSGHGFRAMARTILDEVLHVRPDYIEHQLAHAVRDPNGRAYNRTAYLPERHQMMQQWANYLDQIKSEVVT